MRRLTLAAARQAFLDSSGLLALVNRRDAHHEEAQAIWKTLIAQRWQTFTTNLVIPETHALFLARLDHASATSFLRDIHRSSATIVRVRPADEDRALAIVYQYNDKNFSLTDATSFAVMERLNINHVFTFDKNFAQYGFIPLLPQ